jgi:hypothetical protein
MEEDVEARETCPDEIGSAAGLVRRASCSKIETHDAFSGHLTLDTQHLLTHTCSHEKGF